MRLALAICVSIALLDVAYLILQPTICRVTWSDNHIQARWTSTGCEINEGNGWKSERSYRSDDPAMPALRKHFHSYNFDK